MLLNSNIQLLSRSGSAASVTNSLNFKRESIENVISQLKDKMIAQIINNKPQLEKNLEDENKKHKEYIHRVESQ